MFLETGFNLGKWFSLGAAARACNVWEQLLRVPLPCSQGTAWTGPAVWVLVTWRPRLCLGREAALLISVQVAPEGGPRPTVDAG